MSAIVFNNSDDYEILKNQMTTEFLWKFLGFDQNSSRNRWPRNSHEILQGFLSEFWWPALVSNNSDDYQILQELDDHRILMKFSRAFDQNSYVRFQGFWSELQWPTFVTSQIWIDTVVDYVSNDIEVWGRKQASKQGKMEI